MKGPEELLLEWPEELLLEWPEELLLEWPEELWSERTPRLLLGRVPGSPLASPSGSLETQELRMRRAWSAVTQPEWKAEKESLSVLHWRVLGAVAHIRPPKR